MHINDNEYHYHKNDGQRLALLDLLTDTDKLDVIPFVIYNQYSHIRATLKIDLFGTLSLIARFNPY